MSETQALEVLVTYLRTSDHGDPFTYDAMVDGSDDPARDGARRVMRLCLGDGWSPEKVAGNPKSAIMRAVELDI
jgi:hypothetical protein